MRKNKDIIIVIAHDAGGAELLAAYVSAELGRCNYLLLLSGPAKRIFKRYGLTSESGLVGRSLKSLVGDGMKIKLVLTGIGWSSQFELRYLLQAKKLGIRTVVYLDHWINYRERFGYPHQAWRANLPDEIWVGDMYAMQKARSTFQKSVEKIVFKKNRYFQYMINAYRKKSRKLKKKNDSILFLTEPITRPINSFGDMPRFRYSECDILRHVVHECVKSKSVKRFILRLHPSESRKKYNSVIRQFAKRLQISVSSHDNILDDLVGARLVIGIDSMALAIAALCKKITISYIPNATESTLPFKSIIKLKHPHQLSSYVS